MSRRWLAWALATGAALTSCQGPGGPDPDAEAEMHRAHEAFVAAINSNDVEAMLAMLTDDIVIMAPNAAPVVGKAAVQSWLEGYAAAFETHWDKRMEELVVCGDWAFERYAYRSRDLPRAGGDPIEGTGWGLGIWRRGVDGQWRVARDGWGSDRAPD